MKNIRAFFGEKIVLTAYSISLQIFVPLGLPKNRTFAADLFNSDNHE